MEQRNLLSPGTAGGSDLSRETIATLLARGLSPQGRGDADLARRLGHEVHPGAAPDLVPTPAAVLVPLIEHVDGLTVLLTQRTAHLAHHPGQISFPGGRLEPDDNGDSVAAALRETEEEVGLAVGAVTVLGRLDEYLTTTGFLVTPVVGITRPPLALTLDDFEVAEVFEVPLAFLIDTANHQMERREVEGRSRAYWAIPWQGRVIWGATAGMLVNLAEVLSHRDR